MTEITVSGASGEAKKLKIHATAAVGIVYQRIFKRDFYKDMYSIRSAGEDVAAVQDIFPRIFYVWSLMANFGTRANLSEVLGKTENDYIMWLMDYAVTAFISAEAVGAFTEEYSRGIDTHSESKN